MIARRSFEGRSFGIWAVIAGSLVAGAAYAWFAGEDINWDWRNYHEYNAFALINGRYDWDVAPAGIQTFLNPLAYVPAYLLRHHVSAPLWGMLLGAIHGLNLALICWLSRIVLNGAASGLMLAASVVIAAFGPMTLSEVGTSFADILTALPVIAGVGLMLSAKPRHRGPFVIAGILIGGAVGLKLTNMIFFRRCRRVTFVCGATTDGAVLFCSRRRNWRIRNRRRLVLDVMGTVRQSAIPVLQHGVSLSRGADRSDDRSASPATQFMGRCRLSVLLADRHSSLVRGAIS